MTIQEYNSCVKNHADALFRFIFKSMKDKMEAENVVQNTFEKLWVKREDIVFETSKAFIFKVGYNNMIDIIRKQKREVSMDAVKENRHYTTEHYTGAREVLKTAVDKLPENQKTVLLLRDYEGYDYKSNPKDPDNSFNISAGVQVGYLYGAHQKQKWSDGGKEKRKVKDDYNLSDYRFGYAVNFGYSGFNLYAKYYPTTMFKENRGPELNTVAAGIILSPF